MYEIVAILSEINRARSCHGLSAYIWVERNGSRYIIAERDVKRAETIGCNGWMANSVVITLNTKYKLALCMMLSQRTSYVSALFTPSQARG